MKPPDLTKELAHEIQAPLTSLELELSKLERSATVERCLEEVRGLRHLVVSFLELDTADVVVERFPLAPTLSRLERRFHPLAEAKEVRLTVETTEAHVNANPAATERILQNVMDNAIKFSRRADAVSVTPRLEGAGVFVDVVDGGIGLTESELARVFEPFYRVDKEAVGTGLGLSIAKRLAEAQHGSLRIDSTPGAGTRVRLSLRRG